MVDDRCSCRQSGARGPCCPETHPCPKVPSERSQGRSTSARGLDHLGELFADFKVYYNEHRSHQRLGGATPATVYRGQTWKKPDPSAKQVTGPIRLRHFREQRITVYELAA